MLRRRTILLTTGLIITGILLVLPVALFARKLPCRPVEYNKTLATVVIERLWPIAFACPGGGPMPDPNPVLLVHGVYASDSTWTDGFKQYLEQRGYRVFLVGPMSGVAGANGYEPNNGDINVLAVQIDNAITAIKAIPHPESGRLPTRVDVVAHSLGGLITRTYIQSPQYDNDIGRFLMLGTPNHGSPITYNPMSLIVPIVGGSADAPTDDAARRQMWPLSQFQKNLNNPDTMTLKNVQAAVIGGTKTTYSGWVFPANFFSPVMTMLTEGDGIVPLRNMKIKTPSVDIPLYLVAGVNHSSNMGHGYPDDDTVRAKTVEFLRTGTMEDTADFKLDTTTIPPKEEGVIAKLTHQSMNCFGGLCTFPFILGSKVVRGAGALVRGAPTDLQVIGETETPITPAIEMTTPDGTFIDQFNYLFNLNFDYHAASRLAALLVSRTEIGTYQVTFRTPPEQQVVITPFMFYKSLLGMANLTETSDYRPCDPIPFRVRLFDRSSGNDVPITAPGFTVRAEILNSDGTIFQTVPLVSAGNGEYQASVDSCGLNGEYQVRLIAEGDFDISTPSDPDRIRIVPMAIIVTN